MNHHCNNPIVHTIVAGDTLWSLANRHNTTVDNILALNPGTEIYNLQIGANLLICPNTVGGGGGGKPVPPVCPHNNVCELVMHVLRWVRENYGENFCRQTIMDFMSSKPQNTSIDLVF